MINPPLIKSCSDCKAICCKTGPGPYKILSPNEYLEGFGTFEAYNTRCAAIGENNECTLWGTDQLPLECRIHVCNSKEFSKKELQTIENVYERECQNCESQWVIIYDTKDDKTIEECEACGHKFEWTMKPIKSKKKGRKK